MSLFNTCFCPFWRKPYLVKKLDCSMSDCKVMKVSCLKCGYERYDLEDLK